MLSFLWRQDTGAHDLLGSQLYDGKSFYPAVVKDMNSCYSELIIECPFVTYRRLSELLPVLEALKKRKVRVIVNTRDPRTNDSERMSIDARDALSKLQHIGVHVLYTSNHHRKLVIIDRHILYEGSLNVLSFNNSAEVMRRIESVRLAWEMVRFTNIDRSI